MRSELVTILHLCPRDTGKVAALGPNIMSPEGHKLLPLDSSPWYDHGLEYRPLCVSDRSNHNPQQVEISSSPG